MSPAAPPPPARTTATLWWATQLPAEMGEVAQVNANDGTCEGIKYKKWNCFTVQFHPEQTGGPKGIREFLLTAS